MKAEYDLPENLVIQIMNRARQLEITPSDYVHSAIVAFAGSQNITLVPVPGTGDAVPSDEPVGAPAGIPQGGEELDANSIDILVKFALERLATEPYVQGKQQFFTAAELIGAERWALFTFITRSNIGGRMYQLARRDRRIDSTVPYGNEPRKYFNKNNQLPAAPRRA